METIKTPDFEVTVERYQLPEGFTLKRKEIIETLDIEIPELEDKEFGQKVAIANRLKSNNFKIIRWDYLASKQCFLYMIEWRHL